MSILDDFFGDSQAATPHCSCCDEPETNGNTYVVTIQDNYGPTHWMHEKCLEEYNSEMKEKSERNRNHLWPDYDADTAVDGIE